jgi:hypothetical protein
VKEIEAALIGDFHFDDMTDRKSEDILEAIGENQKEMG